MRIRAALFAVITLSAVSSCASRQDRSLSVAVAANFTEPAKEIARLFEQSAGAQSLLSFGSTGQLFTQITQSAPFEVFLAADQETPAKAVAAGLAIEDTLFTYAVGRLVLFSPSLDLTNGESVLRDESVTNVAIANPSTAPYGAAAIEVMKAFDLHDALRPRIVQGNNIAQTFQFVETGNAELGFVAMSQIVGRAPERVWIIPDSLYSPIRQDAVLLTNGVQNETAREFMEFLRSPAARAVIERYGYGGTP